MNLDTTATAAVTLSISLGKSIDLIPAHGTDAVVPTAEIDANCGRMAYLDRHRSKVSAAKEKVADAQTKVAPRLDDLDTPQWKVS